MFGFLFKVSLIALIVAAVSGIIYIRRGSLPKVPKLSDISNIPGQIQDSIKNADTSDLGKKLSDTLDSIVTHPSKNSPVVLGVKITNDSLGKVVDVIQSLPPDQINQLKTLICAPATPSAK